MSKVGLGLIILYQIWFSRKESETNLLLKFDLYLLLISTDCVLLLLLFKNFIFQITKLNIQPQVNSGRDSEGFGLNSWILISLKSTEAFI